jgi:uncharacterized membrane protein YciS (DUF1049 family)
VWLIRSAIILVGVIGFLWVGMTNADQRVVKFTFFTNQFDDLSLNLLMFIVFAAGMIFSFLIFVLSEFQLRHTIGQKRRQIGRLEHELSALRNLPLEEPLGEDRETPAGF